MKNGIVISKAGLGSLAEGAIMLRKWNRKLQDFFRPIRLEFGKLLWDRKKNRNTNFNMGNIKKVLILRYDGKIGDMIITTMMFRELKKTYPSIKIGVVTRGANRQVIENNPYVDEIYEYNKNTKNLKKLARQISEEDYDLLIDFSEILRVKQMMLINLCKAEQNLGINKTGWKLFDISVDYSIKDKHITDRYKEVLEILGVEDPDLSYELYFTEEQEKVGKDFRDSIKEKKLVVLNPYGASKYRTFNENKVKEIAARVLEDKETGLTFVFPPDKLEELQKISEELNSKKVYINKNIKNIMDSASIIKHSDYLITPDTSIVHIGVALDKNMTAVYRSDDGTGELNSTVWGPNSDKAKVIYSKPNFIEGEEADINEFELEQI